MKGKKQVEKNQNLKKMPNMVKIRKDENYYKNGSNMN